MSIPRNVYFAVHDLLAGKDDLLLLAGEFGNARRLHLFDDLTGALCNDDAKFIAADGIFFPSASTAGSLIMVFLLSLYFAFSARTIS